MDIKDVRLITTPEQHPIWRVEYKHDGVSDWACLDGLDDARKPYQPGDFFVALHSAIGDVLAERR